MCKISQHNRGDGESSENKQTINSTLTITNLLLDNTMKMGFISITQDHRGMQKTPQKSCKATVIQHGMRIESTMSTPFRATRGHQI